MNFKYYFFFYITKKNKIDEYRSFLLKTKEKIDIAERVFIEIFLNNYNFNSTKISKVHYLFNLLKELIRK